MGEAVVECPLFPVFIVGVFGSAGGSGSNSLIWSVSGDGAGLLDPIGGPGSSVSALNVTGGSFDNSSGDPGVKFWVEMLTQALTHDDLVGLNQQSGLLSWSSVVGGVKLGQSCTGINCHPVGKCLGNALSPHAFITSIISSATLGSISTPRFSRLRSSKLSAAILEDKASSCDRSSEFEGMNNLDSGF